MKPDSFVEIGHHQVFKHGEMVGGDVFISNRIREENRIVSVLADGLGSGIKASVLATLTGTMALKCVTRDLDTGRVAQAIAEILPVCSERGMAYSTFTIVDIDGRRQVRIVEHENPPCLLIRQGAVEPLARQDMPLPRWREQVPSATGKLHSAAFEARPGDRLLLFSDGVTQSGLGNPGLPRGWGDAAVAEFVLAAIRHEPDISARALSRLVVNRACHNDGPAARDDITCAVIYFRRPRKLLVATGPPMRPESDAELVELVTQFDGRKVLAGGTTAAIFARQLERPLDLDLESFSDSVPPGSRLAGFDLVTEGMLTLTAVADLLDQHDGNLPRQRNPAIDLASLMLDSDVIHFVVGTKINETLVAPDVPLYLDIRRNLVDRLRRLLEGKYRKETQIRYI